MTNEEGLFSIKLKPSSYKLTIAGVGYRTFEKEFNVDNYNNFNLNVNLARQTSMNWYSIHSIDNIKRCIQNNEQLFDKCKKKYYYYITLEI